MVVVSNIPPALSGPLELFHTTDPLLYNSPILVFYGQAASVGSATSRLQIHIFTPAGLESYTRLAISPSSPYYAAVSALPREEQGDEVCRALAFALSRYFSELSPKTKECWTSQVSANKRPTSPFGLFSPTHVAVLASRLARVENAKEVVEIVQKAIGEQKMSWLDIDIVLPPDTIKSITEDELEQLSDEDICRRKYGRYGPIVAALGEPSFLPSSKMRRAASKPTMVGRSKTFRPGQREIIRKEMCELVDTESSYVQKLTDLCEQISTSFRSTIDDGHTSGSDQARETLDKLFPLSLSDILNHHRNLLENLQEILDASDEAAIAEIEQDNADDAAPVPSETTLIDGIGLTMFAKALVEHLPQTQNAYSEYMTAHATFPSLMKAILKSPNPDLVNAAQEVGEQRLTSLLIEPIQRLPRYTLYIDTMSKQLPMAHPALMVLLKARDVVTNICLSDEGLVKNADIEQRFGDVIEHWPPIDDEPARLIAVVDITELEAPFAASGTESRQGSLIVFADRIVFVAKKNNKALSARALQAEVEKSMALAVRSGANTIAAKNLEYIETYDLRDCVFTEALDGKAVMIYNPEITEALPPPVFQLDGSYAGKASRLSEEITKARLEGRFSEEEREQPTWDVRSGLGNSNELNTFAAVFERGQSARFSGQLRIEIDLKESTGAVSPRSGSSAKIRIIPGGNTFCHIAVDSNYGSLNREKISMAELQSIISRRVTPILQAQLSLKESPFVAQIIARNRELLDSLDLIMATDTSEGLPAPMKSPVKSSRPISPVKQLSSFLTSRTNSTHSNLPRKADSIFTAVPNLPPKPTSLPKPPSRENQRPSSRDALTALDKPSPPAIVEPNKDQTTPCKRLEDTLSTYLLAIQARKGNVVGRVVKARANADQVQVNDLYNALQEDPHMMVLAAQASVDVLFAAFEKFLNIAWKERLGPVMDKPLLQRIQHEAETRFPVDFEAYFLDCFQKMLPQNQRALKGIVKLLAELLDGTGNDGDRGLLTAGFVELLIPNEDPVPYVSIMDRFVEDIEALFGENVHVRDVDPGHTGSLGHARSRSINTGSIGSNASSFRKKFGFGAGVTRENSKSEHDSKVGSVWRSLSKNKQGVEPSTPRATVQRTKSTDADTRLQTSRPVSQDRPLVLGQFAFEQRPTSQDSTLQPGTPLSTIGESTGTPLTGNPRKKRRSSLSDLTLLQTPRSTPVKPAATKRLESITGGQKQNATPTRIGTPTRTPQRSRLPSSFRKENSPGATNGSSAPVPGPRSSSKQLDSVTITSYSPGKTTTVTARPTSSSNSNKAGSITPSRIGLSERPSGNAMKIKPSPSPEKSTTGLATALPTPTKKLRVQSPQKIRERLQSEQRELQKTSSIFQDELSKISDEIANVAGPPPITRTGSVRLNNTLPGANRGPTAIELAKKLNDISTTVSSTLSDLTDRNKSLADETLAALTQSENRTKKLDELYREANAENEALYKRFNDELGKVVKVVRAGEGVEELKRRVKEMEEEMEGLRRERARLRREVVGLRGRLGE
ncbi:hypothetical protein K461DRAFT_256428 [Myriangium duriaei CBS 260.36]|uniref:DH domain-containing protein n=1 Tax=Myriangium duriaei CBS 260.36 TaxID=1168546 RepID=A0A9P4MGV2_9PEZI|nr:hypothetical protein K461DRAFT_256428 [Myriangium duriaei CBS 260.36]